MPAAAIYVVCVVCTLYRTGGLRTEKTGSGWDLSTGTAQHSIPDYLYVRPIKYYCMQQLQAPFQQFFRIIVPKKTICVPYVLFRGCHWSHYLFLRFHFYRGIIFWARGRVSSSSSKTENWINFLLLKLPELGLQFSTSNFEHIVLSDYLFCWMLFEAVQRWYICVSLPLLRI